MRISVKNDFSDFPGLRYCELSDNSGEKFYHKLLNKKFTEAYNQNKKLEIDLDGTNGYASSFLDEAFGNLVYDFSLKLVKEIVTIVSADEPHWIDMLQNKTYNQWEERRKLKKKPKKTKDHSEWYRLVNGVIQLVKQ